MFPLNLGKIVVSNHDPYLDEYTNTGSTHSYAIYFLLKKLVYNINKL